MIKLNRDVAIEIFDNKIDDYRCVEFNYKYGRYHILKVDKRFKLFEIDIMNNVKLLGLFNTLKMCKSKIEDVKIAYKKISDLVENMNTFEGHKQLLKAELELNIIYNNKDEVIRLNNSISLINEFEILAKENNYTISKSPYSNSFYAHKENDKITWGEKPLNSYRLSDHWNWTDNNETHCKTIDNKNYGLCICIKTETGYKRV